MREISAKVAGQILVGGLSAEGVVSTVGRGNRILPSRRCSSWYMRYTFLMTPCASTIDAKVLDVYILPSIDHWQTERIQIV